MTKRKSTWPVSEVREMAALAVATGLIQERTWFQPVHGLWITIRVDPEAWAALEREQVVREYDFAAGLKRK